MLGVAQVLAERLVRSDADMRQAVEAWLADPVQAEANYGHISCYWDVSEVTLMNTMFDCATSFNQDLSSWNVSGFTDMGCMFSGANNFNQDLSSWEVSRPLACIACLLVPAAWMITVYMIRV